MVNQQITKYFSYSEWKDPDNSAMEYDNPQKNQSSLCMRIRVSGVLTVWIMLSINHSRQSSVRNMATSFRVDIQTQPL